MRNGVTKVTPFCFLVARIAISWLNEAITARDSGGSIEILPMVAAEFLRLVTNVKVFPNPSPTRDAAAFIDVLLGIPGVEMPEIGREWPILRNLCQESGFGGDDIRDLWIAAAVKTMHGH